jgi:hypothetical protein
MKIPERARELRYTVIAPFADDRTADTPTIGQASIQDQSFHSSKEGTLHGTLRYVCWQDADTEDEYMLNEVAKSDLSASYCEKASAYIEGASVYSDLT